MKKTIFAALLLAHAFAFGQKASGKLALAKGQTLEVVTNITLSAESMMGPTSGTIMITDAYTVSDATANGFTLQKTPKQVKMDFTVGSQAIKIDSDKPEEMNSMLAQPIKEIMSQKPEFTIDASGKIVSVKGDDANEGAEAGGGAMGMLLPGMGGLAAKPRAGDPSPFQALPAREVKAGDAWTDSLATEDSKNVTVYKVKDITDNEVTLDFTGEGTSKADTETGGMKVKMAATSRATGTVLIDKTTALVKQKTTTSTTETAMTFNGQDMTTTVKTTVVMDVKAL